MGTELSELEKKMKYERKLEQATKFPAIDVSMDTTEGCLMGLYRLDGGRVRALPVADVERKRRELKERAKSTSESENI